MNGCFKSKCRWKVLEIKFFGKCVFGEPSRPDVEQGGTFLVRKNPHTKLNYKKNPLAEPRDNDKYGAE